MGQCENIEINNCMMHLLESLCDDIYSFIMNHNLFILFILLYFLSSDRILFSSYLVFRFFNSYSDVITILLKKQIIRTNRWK